MEKCPCCRNDTLEQEGRFLVCSFCGYKISISEYKFAHRKFQNINRESIYFIAIVVVAITSLVVLKTVPLKTVTEDYGEKIFTLTSVVGTKSVTDTLVVKKDWTVSGSLTSSCKQWNPYTGSTGKDIDIKPTFRIYAPDGKTIVFELTGYYLTDTFSFVANVEGSYKVVITNPETYYTIMTVTFVARQTYKIPII